MKTQQTIGRLVGVIAWACVTLLGCGGRIDEHATDTKTNWLSNCEGEADCGDGLECLCGVCTVACEETATCDSFGSKAGCFHAECAAGSGVCALPETPLEGKHSTAFDDCPRPAEDYSLERSMCSANLDCVTGATRFDDECGCGCAFDPACDPDATYVGVGTECGLIDFDCAAGEARFDDACGCGCALISPVPECTQPADSYIANAEECANTDFDVDCAPGEWFDDECGCGCTQQAEGPDCPGDRNYALLGEMCIGAAVDCVEGFLYFEDECGCGCEPGRVCDPLVDYVNYGTCEGIDFDCEESQEAITDDCGCGCKSPPPNTDCPRGEDEYVATRAVCDIAEIGCGLEEVYFEDECGCGCEPNPACDPDLEYLNHGSCEEFDFECAPGDVAVTDECGCGCKANPACDPAVEYVIYGGCAGALWGCSEGAQMIIDDCGCGCEPTGGSDAGAAMCRTPDGTPLETELVLSVWCTQPAPGDQIVTSEEQLNAALAECAPEGDYDLTFDGEPLHLESIPTSEPVRHVYTVQTDDGIHLGLEYPLYCAGPNSLRPLLVFKIAGLTADTVVSEDACNSGDCPGE